MSSDEALAIFSYEQIKRLQLDKKLNSIVESSPDLFELDELYWFIGKKPNTETCENAYVFTMVSREPRQLAGFEVSMEKSAKHIQSILILARRSRCFPHSLETLKAVIAVFTEAYNAFHLTRFNFKLSYPLAKFPLVLLAFHAVALLASSWLTHENMKKKSGSQKQKNVLKWV